MKAIFILFLVLFCSFTSNTASERNVPDVNDTCSIEQKIASYIIPLKDNNSFSFLDKLVKDKKLVILGEASHYDGVTFETKVNMIKYLNKKHGFDVLLWEACPFATTFDRSKSLEYNRALLCRLWGQVKECQPLVKMMLAGQIVFEGIDCSYYPEKSSFKDVFEKYGLQNEISSFNFSGFDDKSLTIYKSLIFGEGTVGVDVLLSYMDDINYLKNYLAKLFCESKWSGNYELQKMYQLLKSMKGALRELLAAYNYIGDKNYSIDFGNNERDHIMADNVLWYMKHNPKKKVILWCANFHGSRDISQTVYIPDSLSYLRTQVMGTHLSEALGGRMYTIAFTSKAPGAKGILEEEISKSDVPFGFIDYTSLRYRSEFFNRSFNCHAMRRKDGRWLYIWDGLYYIRDQKEPTPLN